jgi:hypothetical protein
MAGPSGGLVPELAGSWHLTAQVNGLYTGIARAGMARLHFPDSGKTPARAASRKDNYPERVRGFALPAALIQAGAGGHRYAMVQGRLPGYAGIAGRTGSLPCS